MKYGKIYFFEPLSETEYHHCWECYENTSERDVHRLRKYNTFKNKVRIVLVYLGQKHKTVKTDKGKRNGFNNGYDLLINVHSGVWRKLLGKYYAKILLSMYQNDIIKINNKYMTKKFSWHEGFPKSFKLNKEIFNRKWNIVSLELKDIGKLREFLNGYGEVKDDRKTKDSINQARSADNFFIDYESLKKYYSKTLNDSRYEEDLPNINKAIFENLCSFQLTNSKYNLADDQGRIYNKITNLNNEVVQFLKHRSGSEYVSIDLVNSQWQFFKILFERENSGSDYTLATVAFLSDCCTGLIYERLMQLDDFIIDGGKECLERKITKLNSLKYLLFTEIPANRNKLLGAVVNKYPQIGNYLHKKLFLSNHKKDADNTLKANSIYARELQTLESDIIIKGVYRQLKKQYPDIDFLTKHDSIIVPVKYQAEAEAMLISAFKKHNHTPVYKIQPLNKPIASNDKIEPKMNYQVEIHKELNRLYQTVFRRMGLCKTPKTNKSYAPAH